MQLHNFKRLLDRVNELLPWTAVLKSITVVDLVKLFYIFLWVYLSYKQIDITENEFLFFFKHLRRVYSFLKALNKLHTAEGEEDKDLDYFLDAFKVHSSALNVLHSELSINYVVGYPGQVGEEHWTT